MIPCVWHPVVHVDDELGSDARGLGGTCPGTGTSNAATPSNRWGKVGTSSQSFDRPDTLFLLLLVLLALVMMGCCRLHDALPRCLLCKVSERARQDKDRRVPKAESILETVLLEQEGAASLPASQPASQVRASLRSAFTETSDMTATGSSCH